MKPAPVDLLHRQVPACGASRAIEKTFIWAYSLRLQMQVVPQLASMNGCVLENNLFRLIKDATRPSDFSKHDLPVVSGKQSTKTGGDAALFREG